MKNKSKAKAQSTSEPNAAEHVAAFESDPLNLFEAFSKSSQELFQEPVKLVDFQINLAKSYADLIHQFGLKMLGEDVAAEPVNDSRFKDEAWSTHPVFSFIRDSYLANVQWVQSLVTDLHSLDKNEHRKIVFYTKLISDALSPTNFGFTNPEVIKETIASNGENLLKGAHNFFHDLQNSKSGFQISTTDSEAFQVGKNLATTEGKVVYQNELMQLIQYAPLTKEVYQTPLIIMPAWINKYYILDLQEKNSFVRWLVEQGHTVFMISWVNPNESHKNICFADYMDHGPIAAMNEVQKLTGAKGVNFIGYCLGGTLLAITIAYLKTKIKADFPINTATFMTSLVDFEEPGDLGIFTDEKQISILEERMNEKGYLDGSEMAQTFSMIRANDMIWSFVINNYLLGKDPFPFDILYWNSDSTRLPAQMHSYYLRNMYKDNNLIKGKLQIKDVTIDLSKVDVPVYLLSTRADHITPWESTYRACSVYTGPVRFTLSASGHVAGIVNPPNKNKYCYWTNDKVEATPKAWLTKAKENPGSWWNDWIKWAATHSGNLVAAKPLSKGLEAAPGSYVKVRI
jgi:polyhydroxyalkanoate synthase